MKDQSSIYINLNKCNSKSFTKVIRILNHKVGNRATLADKIYKTAYAILSNAIKEFKSAQYNGKKDFGHFVGAKTGIKGYGVEQVDTQYGHEWRNVEKRLHIAPSEDVVWIEREKTKFILNYGLTYDVYFTGDIFMLLEFGSGDRYFPSGYSSKMAYSVGTGSFTNAPELHFTGQNGLDTWVYKGEQGTNPYPDGIPLNKRGEQRHGYYYSQGNYPCYAIYKAVKYAKRNYRAITSTASWSHWY